MANVDPVTRAAVATTAATHWPPVAPRGLLAGPAWDFLQHPREVWTAVEWRRYAEHLEQAGRELARELVEARLELAQARAKASRKVNVYLRPGAKKAGKPLVTVKDDEAPFLAGLLAPLDLPRRGRPTGSQWQAIAKAADELRAAAKKGRKRMTRHEAVNEALRILGRRSHTPRETRTAVRLMKPVTRKHKKATEVT